MCVCVGFTCPRCDGPPSLAKEREEEEAAAEADEADEENPAKREAAKHARREARRARRKAKLRRYIAGDWAYVPTYTYCIFSYVASRPTLTLAHPNPEHRCLREPVGETLDGLVSGDVLVHGVCGQAPINWRRRSRVLNPSRLTLHQAGAAAHSTAP